MRMHWSIKTLAVVAGLSITTGCPGDDGTDPDTGNDTTAGTTPGTDTTAGTTPGTDTTAGTTPGTDDSTSTPGTGETTAADSGSSGGGGPPFGNDEDVMMAEQLWADIQGYEAWPQIPGSEGVVPSEAPHAMWAEIFINDTAAGDPTYPDGSIIIKNNVNDDMGTDVMAVTVMWKIAGYEPSAADWFWAKYLPDGSLDTNPDGVPLAGRVGLGGEMGCIPCHSMATDGDYVFTNDP